MKHAIALAIAAGSLILAGCCTTPQRTAWKQTYSSFDLPSEHSAKDSGSPCTYDFQGLPLNDVLKVYEQVSARTVIAGPLPDVRITLRSAGPLNRIEALQLLDTALAQNGITMVLSGDKAVKAVPSAKASSESPPEITLPWRQLPESSSMMRRTVHLQRLKPSETVPVLTGFSKLPNSILPIDSQQVLLLRDYSSNIRQQLKLLEELDREQPAR